MGGNSLRARALGRASSYLSRGADYLAPRLETLSLKLDERREKKDWGSDDALLTTPKATVAAKETSSPSSRSGWRSYFGGGGTENENPYTEENIRCVPGFASLKFGSLDVLCLGTASRSRPLNNANRSQRVFYSLATRFAALPPIPPQFLTSTSVPDEVDEENITAGLQDTDLEAFGKLLGVGGRGDEKAAELAATIAQETATNPADDTAIVEGTAASLSRRPGLPRGLSALNTPTRRSTAPPVSSLSIPSRTPSVAHSLDSSSVKSTKTTSASNSRPSSIYANDAPAASQPRPARNAWPAPFAYEPEDLPRLHQNLQNRLKPFFSQKLQNRQVRLSIYPAEGIWDKPLATKVVITTEAGTFRETVSLGEKELKIILGRDAGGSAEEERERLALMRVKVVTELLEAVGEEAVSDAKGIIASDEVTLDITKHDGLLVISDIDDTIKHTEVCGSTRAIFRNVFVRELDEIIPPGMGDWYRKLEKLGIGFHYVSNGPTELFDTVRSYLAGAGFPAGSVTLKQYGGATSTLLKLFEDPGNRKRDGLVAIFKAFPKSQFMLIGDSGEKDLDIYVSLAQEFGTERVMGIFIRDVTTPFRPDAHPNLSLFTEPSTMEEVEAKPKLARNSSTTDIPSTSTPPPSLPPLRSPRRSSTLPNSPPPLQTLCDPSTDPLSPNNPLSSPVLSKEEALSEERVELIEEFYRRLQAAEKVLLPLGIPLKIFRHGKECEAESLGILRNRQVRPVL